jgi:adenylate kinase family enzyme
LSRRVHILGASGTGTSTLARALASELETQAFDTDDFYWKPSDPPFAEKRGIGERLALMQEMFLPRRDWVLSGSLVGWGDPVIPRLTHVVFLTLAPGPRLARLRARERRRYGAEIAEGGAMVERFRGFLDWAMSYDDPTFTGRSRRMHEEWLAGLPCPVIRLDASRPATELVAAALAELDRTGAAA